MLSSDTLFAMQQQTTCTSLACARALENDMLYQQYCTLADNDHDFEIVGRTKPQGLDLFDLAFLEKQEKAQPIHTLCQKFSFYDFSKDVIDTCFKPIECDDFKIRKFFRRCSENTHNRTLFIVIHGSFAQENPAFFDPINESFAGLLLSIAKMATYSDEPADILSLQWSGKNDDDARIHTGIRLGHMVNMLAASTNKDGSSYYKNIYFITHSHGGNVALVAANFYVHQWFKTKLFALLVATPVLQKFFWGYSPKHLDATVVIQSSEDDVPYWGWWTAWIWKNKNPCSRWNLCQQNDKDAYDNAKTYQSHDKNPHPIVHIDGYYDNEAPSHGDLTKTIFCSLYDIMHALTIDFCDERIQSLVMNIIPDEKMNKHNAPKILMALLPRTQKEEELYKELPTKILLWDQKHREKQIEIYGKENDSYMEFYVWSRLRKVKKLWGSME